MLTVQLLTYWSMKCWCDIRAITDYINLSSPLQLPGCSKFCTQTSHLQNTDKSEVVFQVLVIINLWNPIVMTKPFNQIIASPYFLPVFCNWSFVYQVWGFNSSTSKLEKWSTVNGFPRCIWPSVKSNRPFMFSTVRLMI